MPLFLAARQIKRYLYVLFICSLVICPSLFTIYRRKVDSDEYVFVKTDDDNRYKQYCRQIEQRIINEKQNTGPIKLDPTSDSIPYSYSRWKSSPILPRPVTQCEHAILMDLLSILVKNVFQKHNISYMMMAATLLGSYTRHDLLPWDDDVDLRVSISDRDKLQSIINDELSAEPYSLVLVQMNNPRNYDKVFFSWCPFLSAVSWTFPFIDIFYHDENRTHVWLVGTPKDCPVRREDVFPLVRRPFGSLWLTGPREPMAHFESRKMGQIETGCYAFPYSHKYEKLMSNQITYANCTVLKQYYPYVERRCAQGQCTETLKVGDQTVIHTLRYNQSYRTFLYSERNSSYKPC